MKAMRGYGDLPQLFQAYIDREVDMRKALVIAPNLEYGDIEHGSPTAKTFMQDFISYTGERHGINFHDVRVNVKADDDDPNIDVVGKVDVTSDRGVPVSMHFSLTFWKGQRLFGSSAWPEVYLEAGYGGRETIPRLDDQAFAEFIQGFIGD